MMEVQSVHLEEVVADIARMATMMEREGSNPDGYASLKNKSKSLSHGQDVAIWRVSHIAINNLYIIIN